MEIRKPNCEVCIHYEICFQQSMLSTIVDDMKTIKYLGKKEYSSLLTCFSIDVQCQHFTRKGDKKYETYKF